MKPKVGDAVETLTKFGLISSEDVQAVLTGARRTRSWKAES